MKKNIFLSIIAIITVSFFSSCGDDDKKESNSISGTWEITDAIGVEWEENAGNTGAGTIIDTNDPDTDMIGEIFIINASEITLFDDSYSYEFSDGVISIDFGGGDIEYFNVEFNSSNTMTWTQDEPSAHSDYEENNPDQFLYYQKTFTLERQ